MNELNPVHQVSFTDENEEVITEEESLFNNTQIKDQELKKIMLNVLLEIDSKMLKINEEINKFTNTVENAEKL